MADGVRVIDFGEVWRLRQTETSPNRAAFHRAKHILCLVGTLTASVRAFRLFTRPGSIRRIENGRADFHFTRYDAKSALRVFGAGEISAKKRV